MIPDTKKRGKKKVVHNDPTGYRAGLVQSVLFDGLTSAEDIRLCIEIEEALCEREIILLRRQLKDISKQIGDSSMDERIIDPEACFGLTEEVFNPVNLNVEDVENEVGNYLQKLHIKNHSVASKEVVHDLFSEVEEKNEIENQMMSPEDEVLFDEIRDAVEEKEIIDLRANLQSIAQSITIHERTFEEIEDLITGELSDEIETLMREEAMLNASLSNEIDLHREINTAIEEQDIMRLRAGLKEMIQNEYSHSRSIKEIEGYFNDELDESALELFEDELMVNPGLAADIAFHKEVDKAIGEADVMALRASLQQISQEEQNRAAEKLGVVSPRRKNLFWYAAASVIILMVAIPSLLRHKMYSDQQLYASYYQPYRSVNIVSRSALVSNNALNTALREIDRGNYHAALKWLENAPPTEQDGFSIPFYSGVAYQEQGEYRRAISSFLEVVQQGDNLLVEQSEWYIGLCYLRIEERQKAVAQFRSIVSRKGFYKEQSGKLLKQLE